MTDVFAAEAAEIAALEKEVAIEQPKADAKVEQTQAPVEQDDLEQELPDDNDQPAPKFNPGQIVRKRDFLTEKERRETAEKRAQELEARYAQDMAKVNERLAIIAQQNAQPQPKAEAKPEIQIPDVTVDPIGHFQAKQAILEQKLAEAEKWRQSQQQTSEADQTRQKIAAEVSRLEAEYAAKTPDYPDAQKFLQEKWVAQGRLLGATPEQSVRFFAEQVVRAAATQNRNPGEVAYEFAKMMGYAGKQAAPAPQQKSGPDLDTIARGQAVSKSTSTAPGRAAPGQLSAEALLGMDDDEFAKRFASRNSPEWEKTMRKLMGA
jgi:hypothetical protein